MAADCHPAAPHKKLHVPDWYISKLMIERALDAILRRVGKLDRAHDIPYLAGYSNDGKTIYIDRHMPRGFKFKGRMVETDKFLILHEEVEKTLIDQLGLHYLHAHQIALHAEQSAVRAAQVEWRAYNDFTDKYVKTIGDERLVKVPADLDLKPYRDEHDFDLMKRMLASMERGEAPKDVDRKRLDRVVRATMSEIAAHRKRARQVAATGGKTARVKKAAAKKAAVKKAAVKKAAVKKPRGRRRAP